MVTPIDATRFPNAIDVSNDPNTPILIIGFTGAPVNGTSGTGAGKAGPGSLLFNSATGALYQNTNTKASPTWVAFGSYSPSDSVAARNVTGGTINKGTSVYINGYDTGSARLTFAKADADAAGPKIAQYVLTEDVATATNTVLVKSVLSIATLNTVAGAVGDAVYLDTTAGGWTLTAPVGAGAVVQEIGRVVVASATVGQILFTIMVPTSFGSLEIQDGSITTAKIATANVTAAKLTATMILGTIPLPVSEAKLQALGNAAANGGVLATDTAPAVAVRNGTTDPGPRITWAAAGVVKIVWEGVCPEDLDDTVDGVLHFLAGSAGAADTPVLTAGVFVGTGGSDLGGNTAALGPSQADKTVAINFPAACQGKQLTIYVFPAAHGTDAVLLDSARLVYTKK